MSADECGHCKVTGIAIRRCGRCHRVGYCSKEHQRAHFPLHRHFCMTLTRVIHVMENAMFMDMIRFSHRVNIQRTWEDPEKTIFYIAMELSDLPYRKLEEVLDVYSKGVGMTNVWRSLTLNKCDYVGTTLACVLQTLLDGGAFVEHKGKQVKGPVQLESVLCRLPFQRVVNYFRTKDAKEEAREEKGAYVEDVSTPKHLAISASLDGQRFMMDLTCAQFGLTAHRDIAPNKRIPASFPQLPVYITMLPPLFDQGQDGDFSPPQPWLQVFRSNPVHRKQSHPLWFVAREIYTMKHATNLTPARQRAIAILLRLMFKVAGPLFGWNPILWEAAIVKNYSA